MKQNPFGEAVSGAGAYGLPRSLSMTDGTSEGQQCGLHFRDLGHGLPKAECSAALRTAQGCLVGLQIEPPPPQGAVALPEAEQLFPRVWHLPEPLRPSFHRPCASTSIYWKRLTVTDSTQICKGATPDNTLGRADLLSPSSQSLQSICTNLTFPENN